MSKFSKIIARKEFTTLIANIKIKEGVKICALSRHAKKLYIYIHTHTHTHTHTHNKAKSKGKIIKKKSKKHDRTIMTPRLELFLEKINKIG